MTLAAVSSQRPTATTALLRVELTPKSAEFAPLAIGGTSEPQTAQLVNLAAKDLDVVAVRLIGPGEEDFILTLEVPPPFVLAGGTSVPLHVSFAPGTTGWKEAQLEVELAVPLPHFLTADLAGLALGLPGADVLLDAGGAGLVAASGETWSADFGHAAGQAVTSDEPISGTDDPALYQAQREGELVLYEIPLPSGSYEATLHFAETEHEAAGLRVFDVFVGGQLALGGLDLFATAGFATAWTETLPVTVEDGTLELALVAEIGLATLAGLEVRSVPVVVADVPKLDFGVVETGHTHELTLTLSNLAPVPALLDTLEILQGPAGSGAAFSVLLGRTSYHGASGSVSYYEVDAVIPAGGTLPVIVTFAPTTAQFDECTLRLGGDFGVLDTILAGIGGQDTHGSLHVVIRVAPVNVDYDGDGVVPVVLNGLASHTHLPGAQLTSYVWSLGGEEVATGALATVPFPLGSHEIALTITDDSDPPNSHTGTDLFEVVPSTEVPGVLVRMYLASGPPPVDMLDSLPSQPDWAQVRPAFTVPEGPKVGGSPFTGNLVVRMNADLTLPTSGVYTLVPSGGAASLIFMNGAPAGEGIELPAGVHELEARFAVNTTADLPLEVSLVLDDGRPEPIPGAWMTHDQSSVPPVIGTMPTLGTSLGGNMITIDGFGFYPAPDVVVHWGDQMFTGASLLSNEPTRLQLTSPPGSGTISVSVETPQGMSKSWNFTYQIDGPVPITFNTVEEVTVEQPTCAAWGPDGRLYVGSLTGKVTAIEFDDQWQVVSQVNYSGVQGLASKHILGIAFSPHDPHDPPRIYVGHGHLYAQGGGSFSGPSPYTGQVSVLEGPNFSNPVPLITQLPTSNHDHGVNGMAFDDNGDLLVLVGGNTNAGVKHPAIGDLPESPLSGALLKAELSRPDFDGSLSYVETASGLPNDDQVFGEVVDLVPGKHVHVHAPGLRNAFDLVYTTSRRLYATDNGPNFGFGAASTGPASQTTDPEDMDEVLLVERGNYYGHPNRNRGRCDERENVYKDTSVPSEPEVFTQTMMKLDSSTNGVVEYRAQTFQGQMRGNLVVQRFLGHLRRLVLSPDGRSVAGVEQLQDYNDGLGLETGPGGVLFVISYYTNLVKVLVPEDASALGLKIHDVHPWRAPATGGTPFVIGGNAFGTLGDTSVTFGDIPAQLTEVTPTRIRGIVPAHASPPAGLVSITVSLPGGQATLPQAFRFLGPPGTAPGWWEPLPEAPASLGEVAAGIIDGVLYLVGEGPTGTYPYDILAGEWLPTLSTRPFPGHHHAAETLGGKLYLIGGLHAGSTGQVQIFDPATDTWSLGAPMPWQGGSVSTARIDGKIYACGGIVGTATVNFHAVYDPQTDAWSPRAPMPVGRNHTAATTDGQKLYVIGGRDGGNWVGNGFDDVQVYDPATDAWQWSGDGVSGLAPLPQFRGGMGKAVYYEGEIYVFGGETLDGPGAIPFQGVYDRVDVYRPETNTWRLEAPMLNPRHGIFPVLFQSRMFLPAGGAIAGFSHSKIFDVFTRQ